MLRALVLVFLLRLDGLPFRTMPEEGNHRPLIVLLAAMCERC